MTKNNTFDAFKDLKINCEACFGFCCVALYFSAKEGFPADKKAGQPCSHLQSDFKCTVHRALRKKGFKGCTAYDCFGAGQKVAQVTYEGRSWKQVPQSAQRMFDTFYKMRQLYEILWYLNQAFERDLSTTLKEQLGAFIEKTEQLTNLDAKALIDFDLVPHRMAANALLKQASEIVRGQARGGQHTPLKGYKTFAKRPDFIGKDLSKTDLRGADLSGSILIAANLSNADLHGAVLIGADLRDTLLKGANLEACLFVTQGQINTAIGDANTKLPAHIVRPLYWSEL